MATYILSDIHGSFLGLKQVFEKANFNYDEDILIQTGDVVDGISDVRRCVDKLLKIKNLISIKGNHDDVFNNFIKTGYHQFNWSQGAQGTSKSYEVFNEEQPDKLFLNIPESHRKFFAEQKLYHVDEENRLFVHGGFNREHSIKDLEKLFPEEFYWDRDLWKKALCCHNNEKLKTKDNFKEIFIGHTPTLNWKTDLPMNSGGVWNLDTGSGYKNGKLTLFSLDTGEYWQSDMSQELYPFEELR